MDLNELLHAHQVEVMKARMEGDDGARQSHYDQVAFYAGKIGELRQLRPISVNCPPSERSDTVVYGTYAGDHAPIPGQRATQSWEDEGGSLDPPQVPLPDGMSTKTVRQFFVGRYAYTDFAAALAEHARQRAQH